MPSLTPLFLSKLINLANKGVKSAFMPRCHSCEMPRDLVQSVCNLTKQEICKLRHVRDLNSITCLVSPHISLGGVPTLIWLETSFIFLINYTEPPVAISVKMSRCQDDIFPRIELIPSFVLSNDNTNCKNDIQLFHQLFDELSVHTDYH